MVCPYLKNKGSAVRFCLWPQGFKQIKYFCHKNCNKTSRQTLVIANKVIYSIYEETLYTTQYLESHFFYLAWFKATLELCWWKRSCNLFSWSSSNFFPGIGIPSFFYVSIPEVFKSNSSVYKNRLKWSVVISMVGLIGNEFIAKYTPGRGVFDWNDILWTLIGGSLFILVNKLVEKE